MLVAQTEIGDSKSSLLEELGDKLFENKKISGGELFIVKDRRGYMRFIVINNVVIAITEGYYKSNPESLKLYHETEQFIKSTAIKDPEKEIWYERNPRGKAVSIKFINEGNEYQIFIIGD